jgi:glycosyltransferase involved in cell wall biosynthesis
MKAEHKSVLLVSVNTFYGGGEVHLVNLARLLAGHCDIHALVFDPALGQQLTDQGVKVYKLSLFPRAARLLQVLHALSVLPFIICRRHIRVVLVTGSIETLLLPISRLLRCTSISMRHLVPFLGHGNWLSKLRRVIIEMVYWFGTLFAHSVICVSETVAMEMGRITSQSRLRVIPNWVPTVPMKNVRHESQHLLRLLFVGRLECNKGLHLLLEALEDMSGYELTVVGDGTEMAHLRSLAAGKNVLFCGFQADTSHYYQNADIFVMPSVGPEGLPLVTIEAMSHGLPCVLSNLPVHVEVSQSGSGAILFKSGDAASLRARLQDLMGCECERKRFGDAAYQVVLQRYSPQGAIKAYLNALAISDSGPVAKQEHAEDEFICR